VGHGPIQADAAEPPPPDRIVDFSAQALVAQLVAVFQVQQPQQRVDWNRRPPQPAVEQPPPRRDEPVVVQVGVDADKFGGQPLGLLGQQQLPDRGLRIGLAQHR
jgi:hypothetical protein